MACARFVHVCHPPESGCRPSESWRTAAWSVRSATSSARPDVQARPLRDARAQALRLYRGVKYPALRKHRKAKRRYTIVEDNDPTGYKSNAAKAAKKDLGIEPIEFPAYSPHLNPLGFGLWDEAEARMNAQQAPRGETAEQ